MNKWRFIDTEIHSAAMNMALDEACMEELSLKKTLPTIRFYRWKPSSISIGYFQNLEREIDLKKCSELDIDIVRRQTGGGAVFHDYEGEITYSLIAPANFFPKNIIESYQVICSYLIDAFQTLGIESKFSPINDIVLDNGKKISGNAQTRKKNILLQHGTILYKVDVKKMFSILKVPDEKLRDKLISNVAERVSSISAESAEITMKNLEVALKKSFLNQKEIVSTSWSEEELKIAQKLAKEKYSSKDWNFLR